MPWDASTSPLSVLKDKEESVGAFDSSQSVISTNTTPPSLSVAVQSVKVESRIVNAEVPDSLTETTAPLSVERETRLTSNDVMANSDVEMSAVMSDLVSVVVDCVEGSMFRALKCRLPDVREKRWKSKLEDTMSEKCRLVNVTDAPEMLNMHSLDVSPLKLSTHFVIIPPSTDVGGWIQIVPFVKSVRSVSEL